MLKRITDNLFMLFASILLVSHAIVPHLHFNNEIFIITPTCITDEEHRHNAPEHNTNEAENDTDFCLLKQVVLARLDDSETVTYKPVVSYHNNLSFSFSAVLNNNAFHFRTHTFKNPPLYASTACYTRLVACNVNPRGSPIV